MKWFKFGLIFNPENHIDKFGKILFAQSPQTLVFDDFVRIYFSSRTLDDKGKFLSKVYFIDYDLNEHRVINFSANDVIELGSLGSFDEHGIFPINLLRDNDEIFAFTCGWSRRVSVSVETSIGLAKSFDEGRTFQKVGKGPILSSSVSEPMLVGDGFVLKEAESKYHMWYIFGKKWIQSTLNEPPARVYKIGYAISEDIINWKKFDGIQIIEDKLNENECQALPSVIEFNGKYHMVFCYRYATDFRKNKNRGYKLGYAHSIDLKNWTRNDKALGIDQDCDSWELQMMCYPHFFKFRDQVFILYNGNDFGKNGFGLAKLIQE